MIREGSNILRIGVRKNVGLQAVFAIILNSVANSYQSHTLLISVFFMDSARQGSDLGLTTHDNFSPHQFTTQNTTCHHKILYPPTSAPSKSG